MVPKFAEDVLKFVKKSYLSHRRVHFEEIWLFSFSKSTSTLITIMTVWVLSDSALSYHEPPPLAMGVPKATPGNTLDNVY
jgi:hypothetical protein